MKKEIARNISKALGEKAAVVEELIEIPKDSRMGDYALPCFYFAKELKKSPAEIAKEIAEKVDSRGFEKVEACGAYVNFFIDRKKLASEIIQKVFREGEKYGYENFGQKGKVVVEMSSPNIAKPFGIGHLRSTIIGNSLSRIYGFQGHKVIKINYLGDWGTQFGRIILGWKKFGSEAKLKNDPIKHLLEIYVKANKKEFDSEAREWFQRLESGDREAERLWKKFREMSLKDFSKIYSLLGVEFDAVSGESEYNKKMKSVLDELRKKKIIRESDGALICDLKKEGLGVAVIKKKDGATLYMTRDLAAAIDRYKKHKFLKMIYEVGAEQKLHFQQLFKILEMMGYKWADGCVHVEHGLYLDKDGKKFATRKGKTVFMQDVLKETIELAKKEISKRDKSVKGKTLEERARKIAVAAIFYGDLKNHRRNDVIFDLERFLSFEGDTGPYLLYSYARAKSILRKARSDSKKKLSFSDINDDERNIINFIGMFPEIVIRACKSNSPNIVANYAYQLAKEFNEFYHKNQVLGNEKENLRLSIVGAFAQTLKNALWLLGISTIEEM